VARRWARQLRAEGPVTPPDRASDRASDQPGPAERAELAELAATVRAAVAQLPDGQRRAVFLFYLQGLTTGRWQPSSPSRWAPSRQS